MRKRILPLLAAVVAVCGVAACGKAGWKRVAISDQYSAAYGFAERPKLGMSTLKVSVFDKAGEKTSDVEVLASYDMPSMRGHHAYGPAPMAKSKGGDYLLPVQFVMRGDWEIVLTFRHEGQDIHTETISLDL